MNMGSSQLEKELQREEVLSDSYQKKKSVMKFALSLGWTFRFDLARCLSSILWPEMLLS
jgi:hypothetical protein